MTEKKRDILASYLRRDILSGKYGSEGGIPEERELVRTSGFARGTVNSALTLLEGEGLIVQRGHMYYVNSLPITMTSYVPPASDRHKHNFVRNIGKIERRSLPEHLVVKLEVPSDTAVIFCNRLAGEIVDGKEKPTQLSSRYYFLPLSEDQVQRMRDNASYDPAWDTSDVLKCIDKTVVRPGTSEELKALTLPEGTAIQALTETIREHGGKIVMFHEDVLAPRIELSFAFEFVNKPENA